MDPVIFLVDAHGSTGMLLTPVGTAARMGTTESKSVDGYTCSSKPVFVVNYDAYGRMLAQYEYDDDYYAYQMIPLAILPGSLATSLLYSGELTDGIRGAGSGAAGVSGGSPVIQQYLRARYYDPATGRFPTLDPFAGNTSDPLSLHKYLYTHGNPVIGIDPSGMITMSLTELQFTVGIGVSIAALTAWVVTSGYQKTQILSSAIATTQIMQAGVIDALNQGLGEAGDVLGRVQEETAKILNDLNRYAGHVKELLRQAAIAGMAVYGAMQQLPVYPVPKSLTPTIYTNTVQWLAMSPKYTQLTYFGPNLVYRTLNRYAAVGHLPSAGPGLSWDEFPYASTMEGGKYPYVAAVPWRENSIQGGILGVFYTAGMRLRPGKFLVLPIP